MANLKIYFSDKVKHRHKSFLKFVQMMANRLTVGQYRYGDVHPRQQYRRRINNSLKNYDKTGNTEFLIDIANYCWLEFIAPAHKWAHFEVNDSNGSRINLHEGD